MIHRPELGAEIAEVKAELKTDFAAVKGDILKRTAAAIGSVIGFQTAATLGTVIALVKIFAKQSPHLRYDGEDSRLRMKSSGQGSQPQGGHG